MIDLAPSRSYYLGVICKPERCKLAGDDPLAASTLKAHGFPVVAAQETFVDMEVHALKLASSAVAPLVNISWCSGDDLADGTTFLDPRDTSIWIIAESGSEIRVMLISGEFMPSDFSLRYFSGIASEHILVPCDLFGLWKLNRTLRNLGFSP